MSATGSKILLAGLCTALVLAGPGLAQAPGRSAAEPVAETRVSGLEYPWSLAFLPDGRMLVTEKPGRLRLIGPDGLDPEPVSGVPDVLYSGQGGLLDVALHPAFDETGWVYLTWSEGTPRDNTLHLGRARLEGHALTGLETLFEATPRRGTDVHYGGRIAFLPDGSLVLGIGEGFDYREQAQRPQTHLGSFVHLADDGRPLASPFSGAAPGVFTIGHRNPQAVVFDPVSGRLYANEHGPRGGDEINILVEGANYGWPITSHGIDYTGALVTPFQTYPGMTAPLHVWVPSIAPAGMTVYHGAMFPEWEGDLFVAALIPGDADVPSGHVRRVDIADGAIAGEDILLGELEARIRDVRTGPDGAIWVLTDEENGRLVRLARDE